ncbi:Hef nuclease [mine drainage metagenome]|uniref:Hef nuclease n=1 Tax=mine drainage metagenome TaxID=410659 RepID=T1B0K5_9ZZZZ
MPNAWEQLSPYNVLINTEVVEPRAYQINIAKRTASGRNFLVILPTGLGKTLIAAINIARVLYGGKRALIVAPTKPLSEQHYQTLLKLLKVNREFVLLLTGGIRAKERYALESAARIVVATPQTIANDMKKGGLDLSDFGLVVIDECHKAVGKYAYTFIADECKLRGIQVIGLTASPGSDRKKINKLVDTLGIQDIEIRTAIDPDVTPYVMDKYTEIMYVDMGSTIERITSMLKPLIEEHLGKLYSIGLSPFKKYDNLPKRRLLAIGENINKIEAKNYRFMALYNYVYVLDISHALELVSTEGIYPFLSYMESLANREKRSRAVNSLLSNEAIRSAMAIAKDALDHGEEHPKMMLLAKTLRDRMQGKSVMVFAQYRSTIKRIVELLDANGLKAYAFVGKKEGNTQAQQHEVIERFRRGEFNILVATSIGEEGLDIPSVDAVVFYEPVPSEIRTIQRKGRAGRLKSGRTIILVTRRTKDETYLYVSRMKETRMKEIVDTVKRSLADKNLYNGNGSNMDSGMQKLL